MLDFLRELRPFLIFGAVLVALWWYSDENAEATLAANWYCDDTYGDGDDVWEDVTLGLEGYCLLDRGNVRIKIPTAELRLRRKVIERNPYP